MEYQLIVVMAKNINNDDRDVRAIIQESPPIDGEMRNSTSLIPERLSSIISVKTCSKNVYAHPCIATPMYDFNAITIRNQPI